MTKLTKMYRLYLKTDCKDECDGIECMGWLVKGFIFVYVIFVYKMIFKCFLINYEFLTFRVN